MNPSKSRIDLLINRRYADYRHGTGVQIKLFADQLDEVPVQFCWDDGQAVPDTLQPACNLNNSWLRAWPFRRGRGLVDCIETSFGLNWQDPTRIAKLVRTYPRPVGRKPRAYVIVASEAEAAISRQVLEVLGAEYVVNVMDYLHLGDTDLPEFPHFSALLKGAKAAFALTPPIQMELVKISGRQDITILGVAREPAPKPMHSFTPGTCLEIVMMGSVDYTRGLRELNLFCQGLDSLGLKYRINYIGTKEMRDRLGTQLPVNYRGVQLGAERDAILGSMHLAYLPGPDGDPAEDYLARYSFPSRSTDYFWHGLPVIGPLFEDSATAQMVAVLAGRGVWFSRDHQLLVAAVGKLVQSPSAWATASEAVYQFAQQNFSMTRTAKTILEVFDN